MKKYKINLTSQFNKELDFILSSSLCSSQAIKKLYLKIKNSILNLSTFPEMHYKITNIPKLKNLNIRRIPIDKYVIIYQVDNITRSSIYSTYILWKSKLF